MYKFTRAYILALSLIAVFTISSQILIQFFLKNQNKDATIINVAGRQRMLSQKITKHTLLLANPTNQANFDKEKEKLQETFDLWLNSHQALIKGDEKIGIPFQEKSQINKELFQKLKPHYQAIKENTEEILVLRYEDRSQIKDKILPNTILPEADFLALMNKIVSQYEIEAKQRIKNLRLIETVLMFATIFILILEALLIFRPIVSKAQTFIAELNEKNKQFDAVQEELRQNLEEFAANQEHLLINEQKLKYQFEKTEAVNQILSKSLNSLNNLDDFLQNVVETLSEVSFFNFIPGVAIFIKNEEGSFDLKAQKDLFPKVEKMCANIKEGECLCGLAIEQKKTQYANCLDGRHSNTYEGIEEHGHYNVPILYDNESLGALSVYLAEGHKKSQVEIDFLENIAGIIGAKIQAIETRRLLQRKNNQLLSTEEELRQNLEEITAIQENLEENQYRLKVALAENLSINNALDKSAIISITDLKGNILKVNDIFCQISGFTEEELLGKNQNIVNSGHHPKELWKELWATIGRGNTWRGEVKNKTKDGGFYWVDAVINPMYDEKGKIYRYLSIRYLITDKKAAEEEIIKINEDTSASIQYAQRIQEAILPTKKEIDVTLPEHFVFFKPRDIVSGDFYWYAHRGYKTVIAAVDCTGHGIPGAFMSLIGNDLLHEIVNVNNTTEPDKILNLLKEEVIRTLRQKEKQNQDGMDIAICTINRIPEDLEDVLGNSYLEYAGAANPLIYFQEGDMKRVKADKIIIGGFRNYQKDSYFKKHRIELDKPTTFYLFSDGIQDQFGGPEKRKFTPRRLRNLLQEIHQKPMEEQEKIINKTINDWLEEGKEKQIDDMLLLGVKV